MRKPLIILTGPTAVGKTALSLALARRVNGEIISADSMQVYQSMDIGTAKIKPEQMEGIKHYLIDELDPREEFNVVRFQKMAKEYISQIYEKNKIPILVGGTGFYIQAVLYDIDFTENDSDSKYRLELEKIAKEKGAWYLYEKLQEIDSEGAAAIHPNNIKRVIRALEFAKQTGDKISKHNEEQKNRTSPYQYCYFVLNKNRATLYESINQRVDNMLTDGLLEEVRSLYERGYQKEMVSMQGIGYKEILAYLEGEYDYATAIDTLKKDTRHFAKRQLTWFKRERDVIWVNKEEYACEAEILDYMLTCLKREKVIG